MPKRSWDSQDLCMSRAAFYQPQLKNKISERVLLSSSSCDRAKAEQKKIEQKTISKLFDAQKQKNDMDVPKEAKSPLSAPLKGLRSILSFFPHSSRLSDTVVQSGLAVSDSRPSKSCQNCPCRTDCQKCRDCGAVFCSNCYFPDYSSAETQFTCRACY